MTCSSCYPSIEKYGANPATVQWKVVRGDTATLSIMFLENDEVTPMDTTGWSYKATAYDAIGQVLDDIPVTATEGVANIIAPASLTSNWGNSYKTVVAELPFDLQIVIPAEGCEESIVWTPVIGTIYVLGDITGGSL